MLVQEMHIQFDTRLQRVNSEAFDIFYAGEKDILLNYAQHKFIRNTLPPNEQNRKVQTFQRSNKRYDDLQTLITKAELNMFNLSEFVQYSVLPYDFFDYIASSTIGTDNCNGLNLTSVDNFNLFVAYLPFVDDNAITDLFSDFKWELEFINATPTIVLADRINYLKLPVLNANDEKFILSNFAIYEVNRNSYPVKVYWEKFGSIYKPNTFIFVSNDNTVNKINMVVSTGNNVEVSFEAINNEVYDNLIGNNIVAPNRLIESEFVNFFNRNPYQKTNGDSPIVELTDNRILLHHLKTFAAKTIELVYLRKPVPINSYLDVSCEIHESRHDKIVDIAVEAAATFIGNPRDVKTLATFINQSNE